MDTSLSVIVAVAQNGVIGWKGSLPWDLPNDRKYFATITCGYTLLMGRATYESIGKPLPGRENIILTRQCGYVAPGCQVVHSWEEALEVLKGKRKLFVIGGAALYTLALPYATTLYLTRVEAVVEGDTFFPYPYPNPTQWTEVWRQTHPPDARNKLPYTFYRYERRNGLLVNLSNARTTEQAGIMQRLLKEGKCPFCEDNLWQYHTGGLLKEGQYWVVTRNMFPYPMTEHHFLLILRRHATSILELLPEEAVESLALRQWLVREYGIPGGATCERFGDMDYSAGSVAHLHEHVIVPDRKTLPHAPVRFKIGGE